MLIIVMIIKYSQRIDDEKFSQLTVTFQSAFRKRNSSSLIECDNAPEARKLKFYREVADKMIAEVIATMMTISTQTAE